MTDANVAAAVAEAQAEVDAAKSLYLKNGTQVAGEDGVAAGAYEAVYLANGVLTTDKAASGAVFKGYVADTQLLGVTDTNAAGTDGTTGGGTNADGSPIANGNAAIAAEITVSVPAGYSGDLSIGGKVFAVTNGTVAGVGDSYTSGAVAGVASITQDAGTREVTITGTTTDSSDADTVNEVATDLSDLVIGITDASYIVETVTAAELQNLAAEAAADLAAAEASKGANAELLADLRAAINTFVGAEGDLNTTVDIDQSATLGTVRTEISSLLNNPGLTAQELATQAKALVHTIAGYADPDDAAGAFADFAPVTNNGTRDAQETGILNALKAIAAREELIQADANAEGAFNGTATGTVLAAAEALQDVRNDLVEAITTAQETLTDAQAYNESLTALIEAHEAAGADVTAAEAALAEAGVDSVVTLTENSNGTLFGADVFLYSPETAAATIGRFEADDQLFIGDYAVVMLGEGEELSTDRLGDSGVLEVFVGQNAQGNAVLSFETQTFAGNAQSVTDIETITITGVAVDELAIAGGFVTLA